MALTIWNRDNKVMGEFHVPFPRNVSKDIHSVAFIQADGDELDAIRVAFMNKRLTLEPNAFQFFGYSIPMTNGNMAFWYGDIARTILLNFGNLI